MTYHNIFKNDVVILLKLVNKIIDKLRDTKHRSWVQWINKRGRDLFIREFFAELDANNYEIAKKIYTAYLILLRVYFANKIENPNEKAFFGAFQLFNVFNEVPASYSHLFKVELSISNPALFDQILNFIGLYGVAYRRTIGQPKNEKQNFGFYDILSNEKLFEVEEIINVSTNELLVDFTGKYKLAQLEENKKFSYSIKFVYGENNYQNREAFILIRYNKRETYQTGGDTNIIDPNVFIDKPKLKPETKTEPEKTDNSKLILIALAGILLWNF